MRSEQTWGNINFEKRTVNPTQSRLWQELGLGTRYKFMCSRYSHIAARVFSMLWLALSINAVACRMARLISKRWLAEWLALSKYVKSLEIRWLALQVSVGSRNSSRYQNM